MMRFLSEAQIILFVIKQTIYDNKIKKSIGYVFRTQSNIYDGVFLQK